jgi:hypothetical protein
MATDSWRGRRDLRPPPPKLTEAELLRNVRRAAKKSGWRFYHATVPFGSVGGFPDVCLVRAGRLIFAELKGPRPQWKPGQREWLADLESVAQVSLGAVEVYAWHPEDWMDGTIERTLGGLA